MLILLMIASMLAVIALVIVLIAYLAEIKNTLGKIGATGYSTLAQLRLGLRAIERETSHLPKLAEGLNTRLKKTRDSLIHANNSIAASNKAAFKQEKYK